MAMNGMTKKEWTEEVSRAVDGAGLPWRVFTSWVEQNSPLCGAELTDIRSGRERRIGLARDLFPTEADRRNEIIRQLQQAPRGRH